MQEQANVGQVLNEAFKALNNKDDRTHYFDIHDDSLITHGIPDKYSNNKDGMMKYYRDVWQAFPNCIFDFDHVIVEGNEAACMFTMTGTQKGEFMGIPPSNKQVRISGTIIFHFENYKIAEQWEVIDLPSQEVLMAAVTISSNPVDRIQKILPLLFPEIWRMQNPNYLEKLPKTAEVILSETLDLQTEAILNWEGVCHKLNIITQPTLVVVGTDDVFTPPGNSLLIAEKINGSRLVQIPGGGHGVMFQYPETFSRILQTFLFS